MGYITTKDITELGACYNEETKSVEFRLFSKNATRVKLCVFEKPQGQDAILTLDMQKIENDIWFTSVKDYILNCHKNPVFYGFRVWGSNWEYREDFQANGIYGFKEKIDKENNRYNPNKIAYDPYSKELSHTQSEINSSLNMFHSGGNYYRIDNSKWAIKSVFSPIEDRLITRIDPRAFNSEIIGEVHIKDLTQNLQTQHKGTYKGAGEFAKNIANLGITMVEFLPINEFDSKQNGTNHWGYMPLGYFTLARKYAFNKEFGSLLKEFREMVDEFHKNNIKVCLDMVYNHTGEAGLINHNVEDANLLSYSLIDNSSYYKVYNDGYYRSNSGCGNDFNANNDGAMDLIVDSLVFWANQGVDAFRFDLAAALLENSCNCAEIYDSFDSLAAKLKEKLKERNINVIDDFDTAQDGIILIAEPWTCGGKNCYQLGKFPSFWAEWNDISRDTIRRSTLRRNEITPQHLKDIIEGTPSKFKNVNKSVNFIASHDGFTLFDLNHFKEKSKSTQGGSDWEICGDYKGDLKLQENAIRKQLALLFMSYGIPMVQIGDMIMHTKNGNNNSYNKDDNTNYLNWQKALTKGSFENRTMEYIRNLIQFRKDLKVFENQNFAQKLTYHYDNGEIAKEENLGYWQNYSEKFFGFVINDIKNRIYVALNQTDTMLNMTLPKNNFNTSWHVVVDSFNLSHIDFSEKDYLEREYILNPNSLAIFMES